MKRLSGNTLLSAALVAGIATLSLIQPDIAADQSSAVEAATAAVPTPESPANGVSFRLNSDLQDALGIETSPIEMRQFEGVNDAVIALPRSSVFEENGKSYVFARLEEDSQRFQRWEVTTGATGDDFIEAKSGVFPGDLLATDGVDLIAQLEESIGQADNAPVSATAKDSTDRAASSGETVNEIPTEAGDSSGTLPTAKEGEGSADCPYARRGGEAPVESGADMSCPRFRNHDDRGCEFGDRNVGSSCPRRNFEACPRSFRRW